MSEDKDRRMIPGRGGIFNDLALQDQACDALDRRCSGQSAA